VHGVYVDLDRTGACGCRVDFFAAEFVFRVEQQDSRGAAVDDFDRDVGDLGEADAAERFCVAAVAALRDQADGAVASAEFAAPTFAGWPLITRRSWSG
jgi:hypothetical protein